MRSIVFYICLLIGCMVMIACKQPSTSGETKDLTFEIQKSKVFSKPGQMVLPIDILRGNAILAPLYISSYDKENVELSFDADFSLINIIAKQEGTEEITLTDSNGVKSSLLTIVIDRRDLQLEISPDQYELKLSKSYLFDITRGIDIDVNDLSVAGDQYVAAELQGDQIKVTATAVGSGTVMLRSSEGGSAKLTIEVMPLKKKITVTPSLSELNVDDVETYRVEQEEDGGVLIATYNIADDSILVEQVDSENFIVTALKPGLATLTLSDSTDPSVTATVSIKVREVDNFFKISASDSITLRRVEPNNTGAASNRSTTLIQSGLDIEGPFTPYGYNKDIIDVKVDDSILTVTAVGRGQSALTLRDAKGAESNTIHINVYDVDLKMSVTEMTLKVGETKTFTALVSGEDAEMEQPLSFYAYNLHNMAQYKGEIYGPISPNSKFRRFSMEITGLAPTTDRGARYMFWTREPIKGTAGSNVGDLYVTVLPAD